MTLRPDDNDSDKMLEEETVPEKESEPAQEGVAGASAAGEQSDLTEDLEKAEEAAPADETEDDGDAAVVFEGDRPLVTELQYKAPKGKAASEEEEAGDTHFSSVAEARAVIEGFLFSCNEPLTVSKLAKLMGNLHPKTVRGLLLELQWEYENRPGALQVVEIAGGYQLCTRPFIAPWMFRMHKHKRRSALSPATLETLAIVAYRQPITRGEIEAIRGVETGAPLRTLQDLNMVEASGRREVIGRPQLYVTTEQFLKTFGLKSVGDLPSISELKTRFAEEQKLKAAVAEPVKAPEPEPVAEPAEHGVAEANDTVGADALEGGGLDVDTIDDQQGELPDGDGDDFEHIHFDEDSHVIASDEAEPGDNGFNDAIVEDIDEADESDNNRV